MFVRFQASGKEYDSTVASVQLSMLHPKTEYLVCVVALTRWPHTLSSPRNGSEENDYFGRCTEVRTLDTDEDDYRVRGSDEDSFLTRRLGLMIGSCMGCIMFVILVIVLVLMKMKKQRKNAKNEQPLPPEYLSYRHFSLQGCEPLKMNTQQGTTRA